MFWLLSTYKSQIEIFRKNRTQTYAKYQFNASFICLSKIKELPHEAAFGGGLWPGAERRGLNETASSGWLILARFARRRAPESDVGWGRGFIVVDATQCGVERVVHINAMITISRALRVEKEVSQLDEAILVVEPQLKEGGDDVVGVNVLVAPRKPSTQHAHVPIVLTVTHLH